MDFHVHNSTNCVPDAVPGKVSLIRKLDVRQKVQSCFVAEIGVILHSRVVYITGDTNKNLHGTKFSITVP
jgi:hypothetical protein